MNVDDPRTFAIIGAAMAVHGELGCGFLEAVYQEALAFEMIRRRIPFQKECELPVYYDGARLNTFYRVDFLCFLLIRVICGSIFCHLGNDFL